jgi:protein disulfide-isomerase
VFSTDTFKKWAKKNVILVEVDSPRRTKLPDDVQKQNEELARKFQVRGRPTILFLDASEKVIGKKVGYRAGSGPDAWIEDASNQIK